MRSADETFGDLRGLSLIRRVGRAAPVPASLPSMWFFLRTAICHSCARLSRVLVCVCLCLVATTAAAVRHPIPPASAPTLAPKEIRAAIAEFAGDPVSEVSFYRVHYWTPLDERTLVIWLGREEPYYIQLREACTGYARDRVLRLGDFQRPGRNKLRIRWSVVFTREGRTCTMQEIRPLNLDGMRKLAAPYSLPGGKDASADR